MCAGLPFTTTTTAQMLSSSLHVYTVCFPTFSLTISWEAHTSKVVGLVGAGDGALVFIAQTFTFFLPAYQDREAERETWG